MTRELVAINGTLQAWCFISSDDGKTMPLVPSLIVYHCMSGVHLTVNRGFRKLEWFYHTVRIYR